MIFSVTKLKTGYLITSFNENICTTEINDLKSISQDALVNI